MSEEVWGAPRRSRFMTAVMMGIVFMAPASLLGPRPVDAASTSSPWQLVAADPPAATGPDGRDINFRRALGLSTDTGLIDQLKSTLPPGPAGASLRYGVALSPAEEQEVDLRVGTLEPAERTPEINAYLATHADTFGGKYLDNQAGGMVTFLFTADIAARQAELQKLFPRPDRLSVRQVAHTEADLNAAQAQLAAAGPLLSQVGLESISVDTVDNAIVVAGPGANATSLASLEAKVGELSVPVLLKPAAHVVAEGGSGQFPLPLMGGESIGRADGQAPVCNIGFLVQRGHQYFATTAGHCSNTGMTWYQNNNPGAGGLYIGKVTQNNLTNPPVSDCPPGNTGPDCPYADAELIEAGANEVSNFNRKNAGTWLNVNAVQGWNADAIGDIQCLSSWVSGYVCGTEQFHNVWIVNQDDGYSMKYQREVNFPGYYGDSGGSVIAPNPYEPNMMAVGSWWGSDQVYVGYFSQIYDVQNQLGVTVVTTPGPGSLTPNAEAAVVGGLSNSLGVYVNAVDGTVQRGTIGYQAPPASESWETLPPVGPAGSGVIAAGTPAAVLDVSTPRQDVFVRGSDGHLYHNWNPSGAVGGWGASGPSGWEQLPGPTITGNPSAINEGVSGVVEVFARDSSGYLYQWRLQGAGWGQHEYRNGAQIQNDPVAQSWGVPGFHVFWRGTDNNLWETYTSSSYPADTIAGGIYGGDPVPVLNANGDWENVFYRGANGDLWSAGCCQGGWTTGDRGGSVDPNLALSASQWGSTIISWFAGTNGDVQAVSCCSPGWSAPWDSGQPTGHSSTPVGVYWTNHYDVFFRDPNNDNWVSDLTCCPNGVWSQPALSISAPAVPSAPRW